MSEENAVVAEEQVAAEEQVDYKALAKSLAVEKESLSNKVNELLGESKRAKDERRKAEAAASEAARKKAEADGNYEQLFKSSESERESLSGQLDSLRQQIAGEKVSGTALRIASEIAEGSNAELLAEFISRRLKFTDDGIKITDDSGNLTVSTVDDLKREFSGSARFASLIKGRQSSGGGATGGTNSGGAAHETISRADFDALNHPARAKFLKTGGKITN